MKTEPAILPPERRKLTKLEKFSSSEIFCIVEFGPYTGFFESLMHAEFNEPFHSTFCPLNPLRTLEILPESELTFKVLFLKVKLSYRAENHVLRFFLFIETNELL